MKRLSFIRFAAQFCGFPLGFTKFSVRPVKRLAAAAYLFSLCIALNAQDTNYYTPEQYLGLLPKPVFKPGNTLPRLGVWDGGPLSFPLNLEMASNWGYALQLSSYATDGHLSQSLATALANTNTPEWQSVQLSRNNPSKFPLLVNLDRFWPYSLPPTNVIQLPKGLWVTNANGLYVEKSTNLSASFPSDAVISPESSSAIWTNIANWTASPLYLLAASNCAIGVIINGGEYGMDCPAYDGKAWRLDPRVQQAMTTNGLWGGGTNVLWGIYASQQAGRQFGILANAVRAAAPNRQLYSHYWTGTEMYHYWGDAYWDTVYAWGFFTQFITNISDTVSPQLYYEAGYGYTNASTTSWPASSDMLGQYLNLVSFDYTKGISTRMYGWLCAGWGNSDVNGNPPTNSYSDYGSTVLTNYIGFLKCLYTAGMEGGIAGYFSDPTNTVPTFMGCVGTNGFYSGTFPTNLPPSWLLQIVALSRVHAEFSWQDAFMTNSVLLPGNVATNYFLNPEPSYEFTNNLGYRWIRTLARQATSGDTNRWLIACWVPDGVIPTAQTNVTVTIPTLGNVSLIARPSGAVYVATPTTLTLQDTNGVLPTAWMSAGNSLSPPPNFRVGP